MLSRSKNGRKKASVMSASSDGSVFSVDERSYVYITDERPAEPLCWEEQLNANEVKLLQQRKPTMATQCCNEVNTHPVIFHHKSSLNEILKQQKINFHLTSCQLPKLQSRERKTKKSNSKPQEKLKSGGKQLRNNKMSQAFNDQLELKGSGMQKSHQKDKNDFKNFYGNFPELEPRINQFNSDKSKDKCDNELSQGEDVRVIPSSATDISVPQSNNHLPILLDKTLFVAQEQYVDIPVSIPNPDEACSTISDGCELGNANLNCEKIFSEESEECNKTSCEETSLESTTPHSFENTDKSERKSVAKIPVEIPYNDSTEESSEKIDKTVPVSNSSFYTPRLARPSRESCMSSRLSCTPSTPPVLSDEILELPKGVSPSKVLLEIRQTFCENIRKESEQLEFDLKELYLKKQLHQREKKTFSFDNTESQEKVVRM